MLNHVISWSLKNRPIVLMAALLLVGFGGYEATRLPIDVFPDLNRPTVTVMTESHGLAPEEVETLVTFPIESAMNGASGVRRVRSASGIGISLVHVEFEWGTDIYVARQIVSEKLQLVRERLPAGVNPTMTPIASIMGEVMLVGVRPREGATPLDARTAADWVIRPRLLALSGVAQVTVMGGELKQYQVLTSPERLARYGVTLDELTRAVEKCNAVSGGGFLQSGGVEKLIRVVGRVESLDSIRASVIRPGEATPITIGMVADVRFAGPVKRGDGSVAAEPAVLMSVQKQPGADTIELTARITERLAEIGAGHPEIEIVTNIFRQADFIQTAIGNVEEAIRDGAVWVVVVLFVFLWNIRTSAITLVAIPLSMLVAMLVFRLFGVTINTMTLGGLAVAVGELVDDSIVDVENIYRRLRENRLRPHPQNALRVIYEASAEVRNSIVYATLIVVLVVMPLFFLAGLEGRMFAPLGLSYITTLVASLLVSLTVTPVLASYLLPRARFLSRSEDPLVLRTLKALDERLLRFVLRRSSVVLAAVSVVVVLSCVSIAWMGGSFLPAFNEGTLTIELTTPAGTSLAESDRLASRVERALMDIPEVTHVSRRTGRAELDEHAENVNYSEIDAGLVEHNRRLPGVLPMVLRAVPGLHQLGVEKVGRPREEVLADIRARIGEFPASAVFNIGQPISHRLDHIMSGIKAQVAVKIFGDDLPALRRAAEDVRAAMASVPGVVDLQVEQQVEVEQVRVDVLRDAATDYGLHPQDVAQALETAFQGRSVSQVLEGQRTFDLVVWFDPEARDNIEAIRDTYLSTPSGAKVKLGAVADVRLLRGPNTINRENVQRRIVVQCNVVGRDLVGAVEGVQQAIRDDLIDAGRMPPGCYLELGGQFEAQRDANTRLLILGTVSVAGVMLLLQMCLGSWRAALQVMVNVPLAAIGSVAALLLTSWPGAAAFAGASPWEWPAVWLGATTLSVAHWVGFITLVGVVCRNGIMMISHYLHLMKYEGESFSEAMIIRGSLERLAPVLMTALATAIGLVPLALGEGETGKEILHPLAVVVVGGLISSTLLDQVVTPALFWRFGRGVYRPPTQDQPAGDVFGPSPSRADEPPRAAPARL